jgi:hypothetical protein
VRRIEITEETELILKNFDSDVPDEVVRSLRSATRMDGRPPYWWVPPIVRLFWDVLIVALAWYSWTHFDHATVGFALGVFAVLYLSDAVEYLGKIVKKL